MHFSLQSFKSASVPRIRWSNVSILTIYLVQQLQKDRLQRHKAPSKHAFLCWTCHTQVKLKAVCTELSPLYRYPKLRSFNGI